MVAGDRLEGALILEAPEPIARAEKILLTIESIAFASYGKSGVEKVMFQAPLQFDLPKDLPFAAGEHRYPFVVDIPDWLPPAMDNGDFGIRHVIEARLDVDWAVDPVAKISPRVVMKPRSGARRAATMRSHPSFHEELVVEVTLASAVIAADETITGQIALRNGHAAQFDGIDLTLTSVAQIVMGSGDRRTSPLSRVQIPAAELRDGKALSFTFPPTPGLSPTYRTSFIDHDVVLVVSADVPWRSDPSFEIPLEVLPQGSIIEGATAVAIVGSHRLRHIAVAMAQHASLHEGAQPPTLAFGDIGPVKVAILDAPSKTGLGVDLDFTFPDLELGIVMRTRGIYETIAGSRESSLLPRAMASYSLRCDPPDARSKIDRDALATFIHAVLGDPMKADNVRLSDHHLGLHVPLVNDEERRMIDIARAASAHAKVIGEAIAALPFPPSLTDARSAWQATANEQSAFLVPTGPSLHGVTLRAQVLGGEERSIGATFRTIWKTETPTLQVVIDLRQNPIPESASKQLEGEAPSSLLKSVLAIFPAAHVVGRGDGAVLEDAVWPSDPRSMLSSLEMFLAWVIETRSERRADAPYR